MKCYSVEARKMARNAADEGDEGTNDLLVSNVIRTNECRSGLSPSTWSTFRW